MSATETGSPGDRRTHHATFTIERHYAFAPAKVFAAWADPRAKGRWFVGPEDWEASDHALEFREGGRESVSGGPPGGPVHRYHATYYDIVPGERIVYCYEMHLDATRISVSTATVEFKSAGSGTLLVFTEQDVFLDGIDSCAERERGTRELLQNLEAELQRTT